MSGSRFLSGWTGTSTPVNFATIYLYYTLEVELRSIIVVHITVFPSLELTVLSFSIYLDCFSCSVESYGVEVFNFKIILLQNRDIAPLKKSALNSSSDTF